MADTTELDDFALSTSYKNKTREQLAEEAVRIATRQLLASSEFKKPRLARLARYWESYDGKSSRKIRQLFNVNIPVFPGMIDTLCALDDTSIQTKFREGEPADYFKVQKLNAAFQMETMNTSSASKWDAKLRLARKHLRVNGIAIGKYTAESDPVYKGTLEVVNLKHYHFQPKGGLENENHLFNGEENIIKTRSELVALGNSGAYDKKQVKELLDLCDKADHMPGDDPAMGDRLSRFKPLGLDPDNHSYVGQAVYRLAQFIIELDGKRYLLVWHPWTSKWVRFERWSEISSSELYPWVPVVSHEDQENLLSKSDADDLYPAADAIVAMFNQELTNREKQNFGARAYDRDMFPDVRKLDEAQHRPDALVPADTKNGSRRISEGIYHFETPQLSGTVNLIDWMQANIGRSTGATDLSQGNVGEVSKKASVTFAEQKAVSKRIALSSQPYQEMVAQLAKRYYHGLIDHMPSSMAIRVLGEAGWDWDQITRKDDLNLSSDVDVLVESTDRQIQESELKKQKRLEALTAVASDPTTAPLINAKWRAEQLLSSVGGYEEQEVAVALDVKTYSDKKALAKASESIQLILRGKEPLIWHGANVAFMQKIVDFANDKRSTLGDKFQTLIDYATAHADIARENMERKIAEDGRMQMEAAAAQGVAPVPGEEKAAHPGVPGGMSKAMSIAEAAI